MKRKKKDIFKEGDKRVGSLIEDQTNLIRGLIGEKKFE